MRDTKRGVEEITREIPNVSEDAVKNLDEEGVIRIGARVRQGDILVGKVTPKGEQELSPEERLLKAIFGDKAGDVRDASLKAPPGHGRHRHRHQGVLAPREGRGHQGSRRRRRSRSCAARARRSASASPTCGWRASREILDEQLVNVLRSASTGEPLARKGRKFTREFLEEIDLDDLAWGTPVTEDTEDQRALLGGDGGRADRRSPAARRSSRRRSRRSRAATSCRPAWSSWSRSTSPRSASSRSATRWPAATATRAWSPRSSPRRTCRTCRTATPVEIVLNPLGVPSRMNIGQVLETHLGWAAHALGYTCATPVFAGRHGRRDQGGAARGRPAGGRQDRAVRRPHRRAVRSAGRASATST